MTDHAGQISLPGGRNDPGETTEQCALRELHEELGVPAERISVLGHLPPILVFASNYYVTPIVATCTASPVFRPNPAEVEELFEVPLMEILNEDRWKQCQIEHGKLRFAAPCISFGDWHVWGATGVILGDLIQILKGR
jgi:8-oxo-dGTP pyrophosphatase MutT (NUDIX family)